MGHRSRSFHGPPPKKPIARPLIAFHSARDPVPALCVEAVCYARDNQPIRVHEVRKGAGGEVGSGTLVRFMLFSHVVVFGRLVPPLTLALALGSCKNPGSSRSPTKSQAQVQREWDGMASVVLPHGQRFALASPLLWMRHGETNVPDPSEGPLTKRCLLLARGVPYLRNENDLKYAFEEAFDSWPRPAV